jgi:hypothetical protein
MDSPSERTPLPHPNLSPEPRQCKEEYGDGLIIVMITNYLKITEKLH